MQLRIALSLAAPLGFALWLAAQQDTAQTQRNPFAGNPAAAEAGHKLYDQACQACHGQGARGDRGPALSTGVFRRGGADGEIFTNIRAGIRGTQMPAFAQFTAEQIWQLVSYLRSLAGPAAGHEVVAGDPAAGRKTFESTGQCLMCHTVGGQGVPVGPDLSSAGETPAERLQAAILNPNAPTGGRGRGRRLPSTVIVRTADGQEFRGVRRNEDSFSLQMVDTTGQIHLFDKSKLAALRTEPHSLMPDDYGKRLSPTQIRDLVAYLKTLNGPDPSRIATLPETGGINYERIRNARSDPKAG